MRWPSFDELSSLLRLPPGYGFEFLRRGDVPRLVAAIASWHPDIAIGGGSCYLRAGFYADHVFFDGGPDRNVMVVVFVHGQEPVGMWSVEKEPESLVLYSRLIVVDPGHRSAGLASNAAPIAEAIGRAMGAEFIFGLATLRIPHVQRLCENVGWQLVGFTSGYGQEHVAPGVVKRVFEAMYCKVLVPADELVEPDPRNLTPSRRALWEAIHRQPPRGGEEQRL